MGLKVSGAIAAVACRCRALRLSSFGSAVLVEIATGAVAQRGRRDESDTVLHGAKPIQKESRDVIPASS
jgi:hypothetical protein